MDFKLTAEQLELQKVARDFAQKELTALADEMEESANPVPKDVLKKVGELGASRIHEANRLQPVRSGIRIP